MHFAFVFTVDSKMVHFEFQAVFYEWYEVLWVKISGLEAFGLDLQIYEGAILKHPPPLQFPIITVSIKL